MASALDKEAFKVLEVTKGGPIRDFLESHNLQFVKGRAYYQLTKGEVIQDYKKVVARRISDGNLIAGGAVREVLKIPTVTAGKTIVDTSSLTDFDIFIQSTSYNRLVSPKTKLLYRLPSEHVPATTGIETGGDEGVASAPTGRATRASKRAQTVEVKEAEPTPAKVAKVSEPVPLRAAEEEKEDAAGEPEVAVSTPTTKGDSGTATQLLMDIAFSFDTTGSMYACLGEVRRDLKTTIQRLKDDIPGIRMAVIAHGDYCDAATTYVTKIKNFTDDVDALVQFIDDVSCTGGGDFDECYELVLNEVHSQLNWRGDSQKSLVMIGDATPHSPNYKLNTRMLNWQNECSTLKSQGIRVYSVQALNRRCSDSFYRSVADLTDGFHLMLNQFSSIINFIMAICYRENGMDQLQNFEDEVRGQSGINRDLHHLFDSLAGRSTAFNAGAISIAGLVPINPARFQVLTVARKCSIKSFVQRNSLIFKAGRGFYEFTKPEKISSLKEVVLVDKVTGDMFTGAEACNLIGAGGPNKITPTVLDKYRVFVQSTSYNRILVRGTGFLYEVDPDH